MIDDQNINLFNHNEHIYYIENNKYILYEDVSISHINNNINLMSKYLHNDNLIIIELDINIIDKLWRYDALYVDIFKNNTNNESKYKYIKTRINLLTLLINKPPHISLNNNDNYVYFINGRHLFSNMRDLGCTKIPFLINCNEKDNILKIIN